MDNIKATYKSNDTEEWLDRVFTRPIGYWWAKLFERWHVHPNTVTVISMFIGASSAFFFAHGSYFTMGWSGLLLNIIGVLLLMWANFYDSADGQLARMTGQKTQLGRILDGASSDVWFFPIYCAIVIRFYFHHGNTFALFGIPESDTAVVVSVIFLTAWGLYSGFRWHGTQCNVSDYYRQIHLFFLNGKEGSELTNSEQQQRLYDATPWKGNFLWKCFQFLYVGYTRKQERRTPEFQKLKRCLDEKYGSIDKVPQTFRDEFRQLSLPIMPLTNILTFNTRAIAMYICFLIDIPWLYLVFETFFMTALYFYMRHRHESFCKMLRLREMSEK